MKWEEWELQMIREVYPEHGGRPISDKTGRDIRAIQQKAKIIGVKKRLPPGKKYDYTKWEASIKKIYNDRSLRELERLSKESKIPIGSLKNHARMVLRLPPMVAIDRHQRPWMEEENEILERTGEQSLKTIKSNLARAGYVRSPRGIECQLTRLNIRSTRVDLITASEFARRMGYDESVAVKWIDKGWLITQHHKMYVNPTRNDQRTHWVSRKNARRFILEHVSSYDHRRIDWLWVLDLLTEKSIGGAAVVDSCGSGYDSGHSLDASA